MNSNTSKNEIITVSIMVAIAAATRFLPHPPNFTAIGGMALFGAATLTNKKLAFIVPIMAMLISDLFIPNGFDLSVYTAFIAIAAIGLLISNKKGPMPVIVGSISASVIFFAISNFGVWLSQALYTKNAIGLISCFEAAIPFFPNTLAADLFFSSLLFSSYAIIKKTNMVIAK
jgi:hypothetical protein